MSKIIILNPYKQIDADFENVILIAKTCQMKLPNFSKPKDSWPDVIYNRSLYSDLVFSLGSQFSNSSNIIIKLLP